MTSVLFPVRSLCSIVKSDHSLSLLALLSASIAYAMAS